MSRPSSPSCLPPCCSSLFGLLPHRGCTGHCAGCTGSAGAASEGERSCPLTCPVRRHPTRREFLTLGTGLFVALSLPARAAPPASRLVRRTVPADGDHRRDCRWRTPTSGWRRTRSTRRIAELQWVERTMTRFRRDSDIGRANRGARRARR